MRLRKIKKLILKKISIKKIRIKFDIKQNDKTTFYFEKRKERGEERKEERVV